MNSTKMVYKIRVGLGISGTLCRLRQPLREMQWGHESYDAAGKWIARSGLDLIAIKLDRK